MSANRSAAGVGRWAGSLGGRVARVWRGLPHERRLAALASIGLFVTLFLPWYQETVIVPGTKGAAAASTSVTGWAAFSFVEAAVLLVSAGVLTLLFQRGEGQAFHLPGGDGWVIMAAGGWACVLVVWRIFDKQSTSIRGPGASISGIEWGIFVALAGAAFLAYAGTRIRAAHQPEPPLPGHEHEFDPRAVVAREAEAPRSASGSAPGPVRAPEPSQSARVPGDEARSPTGDPGASPVAARDPGPARVRPSDDRPYFERPPGWLTARPLHPEPGKSADGPPEFPTRRARERIAVDPDEGATQRGPGQRGPGQRGPGQRGPGQRGPGDPDEAPTRHAADPAHDAPLPPATPAARRQSDEQLTIPLEHED